MRGVLLLPGTHQIVLTYQPPGWSIGIALSTISLLVLLLAFGFAAGAELRRQRTAR
jgi:uncharacterized membrane protein YfhO